MANKPLKSIKFPELPDTYTIPQVDPAPTQGSTNAVSSGGVYDTVHDTDATLTQERQAADAGAVGDIVRNVYDLSPIVFSGMNQYINIGTVGSTIPSPATKTGYQYAIIPCSEGDEFILENIGIDSGYRAWAYADENLEVIKNTNGSTGVCLLSVAPENAAYLIINRKGNQRAYKGYLIKGVNTTRNEGTEIPMYEMGTSGKLYFQANLSKIDFATTYLTSSTILKIGLIPCKEGDVFTLNAKGGNVNRAYAFTKVDGTVLEVADANADLKNYRVVAPANSEYLLIQDNQQQKSYFGEPSNVPVKNGAFSTLSATVSANSNNISDITTDLYNTAITGWTTGKYINTGISDTTQAVSITTEYASQSYRYVIIECEPGDKFTLSITGGGYPRAYAFLDSDNKILERANADTSIVDTVIVAPLNTAKLVINDKSGATSYYGEKSLTYRVGVLEASGITPLKLNGKKMVNFGDSIFGRGQGDSGISGRIAYKTGATVYNCGMSGTAFSTRNSVPGYDPFNFWRLVDAIVTETYTDQDAAISGSSDKPGQASDVITFLKSFDFDTVNYVTIGLGTNDWGGSQTLDNTNNSKDKTTVCGALRYGIETLLTAFPKIIIVILSTIPRFTITDGTYTDKGANSAGYTLQDLNTALKGVADEYHLKFIDNFNVGFNKWTCPQYYASNDGTHPDIAGFEVLAENISAHL